MKKTSLFVFLVLIFFQSFAANSAIINDEISKKYSQIFSQNILNDKDVENYQKIFEYQVECKWKIANKYIFEIQNKILIGHVLAQ